MTKERKQEVINTYKREEKDTGSPEVQIALLTERINESGQVHYCIDETLRRRLETKLITKILAFEVA